MILVIGAGGTVGSALLEQLRALQHPVRAACHSQRSAAAAAARGADVAMIDFADPLTLGPALDGVDSVFLLHSRKHIVPRLPCRIAAGTSFPW